MTSPKQTDLVTADLQLTCRDCGLTASMADAAQVFYPRRNTTNGWSKQCRSCVKAQTQRWYNANRERRVAGQRAYRKRIKETAINPKEQER